MSKPPDLPAGGFKAWLERTRQVLRSGGTTDVPCGTCVACCTSSYFVHVDGGETRTIARIPRGLLFEAPGAAGRALLLGYDQKGRCPMLSNGQCSIYEDRPLTCRLYDCRVFAAAGIAADRPAITKQAGRWAFDYPTSEDRRLHAAVRAAARFLQDHAASFPGGAVPDNPSQLAVLAVKVGDVFLDFDEAAPGETGRRRSNAEIAKAVVAANEEYEVPRIA